MARELDCSSSSLSSDVAKIGGDILPRVLAKHAENEKLPSPTIIAGPV